MRHTVFSFMAIFSLMTAPSIAAPPSQPDFHIGIEMPTQVPVTHAVEAAIKDLGINYINYYVTTNPGIELPPKETNDAYMALCDRLGLDFSISCHTIDPPDDVVKDAIRHAEASGGKRKFMGVVIDELEHARLLNKYSTTPLADYENFKTFEQADTESLAGFSKLHSKFQTLGSSAVSTHVWPVLHHTAARAGFTVCPKVCKETYSTVSLAVGIGAAKQYGRDLWVDCDLWYWDLVPGHTPEEMKSNLLLAYWLGADVVYIEGAGHNLTPAGKQGIPFSLMTQVTPDLYQMTAHGEALRWFCREYLPEHPRKWTFRDIKPDIAIIRFDDTCHGQRYTFSPDNLFGSPNLHSDSDTEAWFGIWNLITHGKTGTDGMTYFKTWTAPYGYQRGVVPEVVQSYHSRPLQAGLHNFFVPINGAVVYDDTVGYDLLRDTPLLFLTGKRVSDDTMKAIRKRVNEGATCVAWGPLAVKHGFADWKSGVSIIPEGKGRFILTDDFRKAEVYSQVYPMIGKPDEIRYRMGTGSVTLRRVTDNEVSVEVADGK